MLNNLSVCRGIGVDWGNHLLEQVNLIQKVKYTAWHSYLLRHWVDMTHSYLLRHWVAMTHPRFVSHLRSPWSDICVPSVPDRGRVGHSVNRSVYVLDGYHPRHITRASTDTRRQRNGTDPYPGYQGCPAACGQHGSTPTLDQSDQCIDYVSIIR